MTSSRSSNALKKSKERFTKVRSSIDCGLHFGNVKFIAPKRGEVFRRLKSSEMLMLLRMEQKSSTNEENIHHLLPLTNENIKKNNSIEITHHTPNIIHFNSNDNPLTNSNTLANNSSSYLLLDIRTQENYDKYHILSAKLYDATQIRRDKLGNDIYAYVCTVFLRKFADKLLMLFFFLAEKPIK